MAATKVQQMVKIVISYWILIQIIILLRMKSILSISLMLFAIQFVALATYATPPKFSIDQCSFDVNNQWTKATIAVTGGVKPYDFIFDEYPENWKYIRQDIYVPKKSLQRNQRFPCKVRVFDSNRNQARATMVFQVLDGKVSLSKTLYAYDKIFDDSFFNSGRFRGRPTLIKSGSYDNQENVDFSNSPYYTSIKEMNDMKEKVDQLVSGNIAKSYGTGLNVIFTENDYQNALTDKNTFSFEKLFSFGQKLSTPPPAPAIPLTFSSGPAQASQPLSLSSFLNPLKEATVPFGGWLNIFNNAGKQNTNNYLIPQIGAKIIETSTKPAPAPVVVQKVTDSVFVKLASSQEIDNMILTVDLFALTKLIQDVNKTSAYSCQQKVSFVNDVLGRVQAAISMKSFAADQLQNVATDAETNYKSIMDQINQKNTQIKQLNISSLKEKLQIDLNKLEGLYSQYNNEMNSAQLQASIDDLNKDIAIQRAKSDVDRQELIRQKLAFTEADDYVKKIEALLNEARARKVSIESKITSYDTIIKDSETQIKLDQASITQLQLDIKTLEFKSDDLKRAYQDLEGSVERFRADIARGSKRQDQYLTDISILEERVKIQKKKLAIDELAKLKQMVATLSKSLPTIESFIDSNYYQCFKAGNLTTIQNDTMSVYVISLSNFQSYIESSYQLKPDWNRVNIATQQIRLTPINVMDTAWQAAFGLPYDIISYASSQDFSFPNDFNCLSPSSLVSGYGIINGISKRSITIDNLQGGFQTLNLGCCSRLESSQYLPSIGQKIYWRGNPTSKSGQFNIYRATCL